MAWYRAGGAGIPASLKSDMNDVLNKKFGTSTTYPPSDWPSDVNLLGPLPEKTASGAIASFSDGADTVPLKSLVFGIEPIQASGTPSPTNPLPISGHNSLTGVHCGKNLLPNKTYQWSANNLILGDDSNQYGIFLQAGTYNLSVTATKEVGLYFQRSTDQSGTTIISSGGSVGVRSGSFTLSESATVKFWAYIGSGVTSENISDIQLEVGNQATTYAPYSAESKKWEFPPFGKNLFDKDAVENDKYLDTTTGLPVTAINYVVSDYIAVKKNVNVYIPNTWTARRWFYDVNKTPTTYLNASSAQVYTPPEDGYIRVSILKTQVDLDTFQIEKSSTATAYEPYQEAYTGSLNALTGAMESTSKKKMLNSLTWNAVDMGTYTLFVANLSDAVRSGVLLMFGMCSTYKVMPDQSTWTDKTCQFQVDGSAYSKVIIRDDDYSSYTGAQFKEAVQGYIIYELATPTEITLDSVNWQTKLGDNNFYSDCGDTDVTYRADIQLALGGN